MSIPSHPRGIPFCPQQPVDGEPRTCGAAALMMAYGSFGARPTFKSVWRSISEPGPSGRRVRTHRLAADAAASGRQAVCLQVGAHPLGALARLVASGRRVIVNHLLSDSSTEGHYSVVVEVGPQAVVVHDPLRGPNRRLSPPEFARLWLPAEPRGEVAGGVLVAVGAAVREARSIDRCPCCTGAFCLPEDLGISWRGPWNRHWRAAFCPGCDARVEPLPCPAVCSA